MRQFKNNESSAKDMIDTVYNVLDRDADSTVGVLREISGLFDDEDKSRSVLESINAFRIEVGPIYRFHASSSLTWRWEMG